MIVWRGLIEASYLEDARVGELLRQRGKTLEAMAYLIDLWRSYPNTPSIESDFFGLSQVLAQAASRAFTDPEPAARAGRGRRHPLRAAPADDPDDPGLPVAIAHQPDGRRGQPGAGGRLPGARGLPGRREAGRHVSPSSIPRALSSTASSTARLWPNFHLGQYDRAVEVAEAIAEATYKDAGGADQPSPNKWQAFYILGQIFDARRQPGKALEYYRQVADRFTDAASAIQFYTRKDLKVPEVSVVRPEFKPAVAQGGTARSR